jgi:hypothetical protein
VVYLTSLYTLAYPLATEHAQVRDDVPLLWRPALEALAIHNGAQERECVFITAVPIIKLFACERGIKTRAGAHTWAPLDRRNALPGSLSVYSFRQNFQRGLRKRVYSFRQNFQRGIRKRAV